MERPASQNHLEAFSADTDDISPLLCRRLQQLFHILKDTSSLYEREEASVLMCSGRMFVSLFSVKFLMYKRIF